MIKKTKYIKKQYSEVGRIWEGHLLFTHKAKPDMGKNL